MQILINLDYNVLSSMLLSQGAPYHQFNRSRESKISKLLWSEYTSTWNWTVSCMAPRWTGMWGALATSPPSGPNIAHEKSRRSCVQLNEKTHNWPWPFKMSVENTITDCVFINRWKTYVRMKSLNYLLFQNNYNVEVSS